MPRPNFGFRYRRVPDLVFPAIAPNPHHAPDTSETQDPGLPADAVRSLLAGRAVRSRNNTGIVFDGCDAGKGVRGVKA